MVVRRGSQPEVIAIVTCVAIIIIIINLIINIDINIIMIIMIRPLADDPDGLGQFMLRPLIIIMINNISNDNMSNNSKQ